MPGRPPGRAQGREQILTAALEEFASRSYREVTVRAIAARAKVDARLVYHYFGSKRELFTAVISKAFWSDQLTELLDLADLRGGNLADVATAYVARVLRAIEEEPFGQILLSLVRNIGTDEPTREALSEFIGSQIIARLTPMVPGEHPEVRLSFAGSQFAGIVLGRYVLRNPVLVSLTIEEIAAVIGPTFARYLGEDLPLAGFGGESSGS